MKFLQNSGHLSEQHGKILSSRIDAIRAAKQEAKEAAEAAIMADQKADEVEAVVEKAKAAGEKFDTEAAIVAREEADQKIAIATELAQALPSEGQKDGRYRMLALQLRIAGRKIAEEEKDPLAAAQLKSAKILNQLAEAEEKIKEQAKKQEKTESGFIFKAKAFLSYILSPFARFAHWLKGCFSSSSQDTAA